MAPDDEKKPDAAPGASTPEETPTLGVSGTSGRSSEVDIPNVSPSTRGLPAIEHPRDADSEPAFSPNSGTLPSGDGPEFNSGEVLAQRYRIVRFIARGGMGEVYEAEDLTLHGRLALKTIRPEIAKNPSAVERFKREINIARRITHPNVSRIYDLGIHHGSTDTMFLTMEFLAGETLRERIVLGGRMSEATALPFAEQIAAGLAAAHEVGIIHRDFKSANVMLVPNPSGQGERAVVTDFGLARPTKKEDGMATISEADTVMGTPAYMAPEQVEGRQLTPAADLYAYGIVLYEMVTAKRPFVGETPLSTAVKRLTEAPPPPKLHVPDLDPVWNSVLLRCLARKPEERYASALDVTRALREGDAPTTGLDSGKTNHPTPNEAVNQTSARRGPRASLFVGTALGAIALAVIGFVGWRAMRSRSAEPAATPAIRAQAPAAPMRHGVAVLGLGNNSGRADAAWLSTAISEMLGSELSADGKLRVASGQEVARLKADLGLGEPDSLGADSLERVGKYLGVDSVVLGSYTLIGEPGSRLLRVDVRLLDATTGNVIASSGASGTETQLFDLVSRVGGGLRQKLGLGDLTPAQAIEVEASVPTNPEAVQLYTEGLAKLRLLDVVGARDLLIKAAKADQKHALTYSTLSSAYSALGYGTQARDAAARAFALSSNLGREQKMQIEARLHEAANDWQKAVDVHTSLRESFPDNVDYGLNLTNALISAGKTKEALVTIEALRRLPSPVASDGRIDLVEARAYQEAGDFAKERTLAIAAAAKGRANGSRLLVARARMLEATALLTLGDMPGTNAAADEARALFQEAGDRGSAARALELLASCVSRQGDYAGERRLLEQALAVHREVGDKVSIARVLINIGTTLVWEGRARDAETYFDEALATFRQAGEKYMEALALNNIGGLLFNSGELVAAQRRYQEALTLSGGLGEKVVTATALTNIAEIFGCRGDLEEARRMHEESLAINRSIGDKGGIAYDLFRLGEVFVMRGELVAARERYQEALKLQQQIEDKLGAADTRVALAAIAIEQGKAAEAESSARESEEILRTEGATERSYFALAVIAESLLAQGRQNEASKLADETWKLAAKSEDRRVRFAVATTMARAKAASKIPGDVDAALKLLEATRAEASRGLFVASELDARLAVGEIELAAGRPTAKQRLAALEKDAKARGFGRIARRAAAGAA